MTPWTPRERALYEALEKIRDEAETPLLEPDGESVAMMLCCYCGNVPHEKECPHFIASAALADPPPPDPRDEALDAVEVVLDAIVMRLENVDYGTVIIAQSGLDALPAPPEVGG